MISADKFVYCSIGDFKIEYVRHEDGCLEFQSTEMVDDQGDYFVVMVACYKESKEFKTIWQCVYDYDTFEVYNEIKRKDRLAVEQLMKMILTDDEYTE